MHRLPCRNPELTIEGILDFRFSIILDFGLKKTTRLLKTDSPKSRSASCFNFRPSDLFLQSKIQNLKSKIPSIVNRQFPGLLFDRHYCPRRRRSRAGIGGKAAHPDDLTVAFEHRPVQTRPRFNLTSAKKLLQLPDPPAAERSKAIPGAPIAQDQFSRELPAAKVNHSILIIRAFLLSGGNNFEAKRRSRLGYPYRARHGYRVCVQTGGRRDFEGHHQPVEVLARRYLSGQRQPASALRLACKAAERLHVLAGYAPEAATHGADHLAQHAPLDRGGELHQRPQRNPFLRALANPPSPGAFRSPLF